MLSMCNSLQRLVKNGHWYCHCCLHKSVYSTIHDIKYSFHLSVKKWLKMSSGLLIILKKWMLKQDIASESLLNIWSALHTVFKGMWSRRVCYFCSRVWTLAYEICACLCSFGFDDEWVSYGLMWFKYLKSSRVFYWQRGSRNVYPVAVK